MCIPAPASYQPTMWPGWVTTPFQAVVFYIQMTYLGLGIIEDVSRLLAEAGHHILAG